MRTLIRLFGVAAMLAALCAVAIAQDTFTLKRVAKEGDVVKYKITALVDFQGQEITFTALITEKVVKVDSNGNITVEQQQSDAKVTFGEGQTMDLPSPGVTTVISKPNGEIVEIKDSSGNANAYRQAAMNNFFLPDRAVKVGDKWSYEIKADEKKGAKAAKVDFEIAAKETIGEFETLKVKFSFKETEGSEPISSEGFAWVSTKDSTLVKMEATAKNVPNSNAPFPLNMKFTMERQPAQSATQLSPATPVNPDK